MMCVGCEKCDGTGRWCVDVRLSPGERQFLAALLRREGNRRIARIETGDDIEIRDALIGAAQRCDDIAMLIEGGS